MNKKALVISLLILLVAHFGISQSSSLETIDIFNLEYVSDPQVSPDESRIVYVRNFKDIMTDRNLSNLWITNFDGSRNQPLTTGNQNDFSPRWSPDGKHLLYKSNKDGSTQLYLRWMDSGAESKLTNLQKSTGTPSWSPDGKRIAFTMFVSEKPKPFTTMPGKPEGAEWNDPPKYIDKLKYRSDGSGYTKDGYSQLFTMSRDGGTPRQITFEEENHGSTPEWTKDGTSILFSANLHEDNDYNPRNSEIYKVDLKSLEVAALTDRNGSDGSPKISPDGKKIAYLGNNENYKGYQVTRLYTMNLDGSGIKEISTDFDNDIGSIQWDEDGKGLYFMYSKEGNSKIGYCTLSGKFTSVADNVGGTSLGRPYGSGSYSMASNGNYAFTYSTPAHPSDLMTGTSKGIKKRITNLNDDLFQYKKLGKVEEIWFESSFDQRKIQGWICYPPDFDSGKNYPLLLEIHGGPFANYGDRFSAEMQLYAAAGYVVLYTNPRGSTSYGEAFGNLIHHNYPSQDYDDLISGVDAVIAKGFIDKKNLFVTGGSGGGVLTAWIVGKTDRFAAAVVAKPVINWYSFVLYADNPAFFYKYWFGELPWENPEAYMKRSPISLVGNVTTPTMLLTGESDFRTPIPETEQYYAALKLQKVESAMVRIPGASHGIAARPSNLIAKVTYILQWFENHKIKEE